MAPVMVHTTSLPIQWPACSLSKLSFTTAIPSHKRYKRTGNQAFSKVLNYPNDITLMQPSIREKLPINRPPETLARKPFSSSLIIQLQHYFLQYQLKYFLTPMQFELKTEYFKFHFVLLQSPTEKGAERTAWALFLMGKLLASATIHPPQRSSSYPHTTKPN